MLLKSIQKRWQRGCLSLAMALGMVFAMASLATNSWAMDVNTASSQQLQEIKGIGPVMAKRILKVRRRGKFTSWEDFQERVKGVGPGRSKSFSKEGLRVGSRSYRAKKTTSTTKKSSK